MTKLSNLQHKVLAGPALDHALALWRFQDRKIVFTNGCFDLLHRGHIEYLAAAADLGDVLVVGVNTDASVRRLKGEHRPLQDEQSRLTILAALVMVTAAVLFDEDTPLELIRAIKPQVLVKGGDYEIAQIVGANFVHAAGGQVVTIPFLEGYSTSAIENKIRQGTV